MGDLSYTQIKKLDLESAGKLTEGSGPADECICSLLSPPDRKGFGGNMRESFKKAFKSVSRGGKRRQPDSGGTSGVITSGGGVVVPLTFEKGGKGIFTTRESVKRKKSCGKCGCDKENIIMKHSYANIKIVTPDVSSICPCPNDCVPTDKLNNIEVTVERLMIPELTAGTRDTAAKAQPEPSKSVKDFAEEMYDDVEAQEDNTSDWSFDIENINK